MVLSNVAVFSNESKICSQVCDFAKLAFETPQARLADQRVSIECIRNTISDPRKATDVEQISSQ